MTRAERRANQGRRSGKGPGTAPTPAPEATRRAALEFVLFLNEISDYILHGEPLPTQRHPQISETAWLLLQGPSARTDLQRWASRYESSARALGRLVNFADDLTVQDCADMHTAGVVMSESLDRQVAKRSPTRTDTDLSL